MLSTSQEQEKEKMLTTESSRLAHALQSLALIALSVVFLPLNTFILWLSYQVRCFRKRTDVRRRMLARVDPRFRPRVIMVTGVGMTKGLALARLFHQAGHDVIGADFEPGGALVCGRVSEAITKFYRLDSPSAESGSAPYVQGLLDVVTKEKVDLWVSCSGVASAVEDGEAKEIIEARTKCRAVQFDVKTTRMLHEKHTFIERTRELGLKVPETHEVTTRAKVEEVLSRAPEGRKYIMKTIGVDDSVRADMTLLPMASSRETSEHIARLKISEKTPWIIQQFIAGREYCTHALVIKGQVKAFVACPSAELLMHYQALPSESALSEAMLSFTRTFAENSGSAFTGHLSFDFLVEFGHLDKEIPGDITLYPIECNPRAHTAVALFNGTPDIADAYMSIFQAQSQPPVINGSDSVKSRVITPRTSDEYYWAGHDVITKLVLPLMKLLTLQISALDLVGELDMFADHLLTRRDGTYEAWDPLPWWWLYHVYWPLRFWTMLIQGRKWSRVNVSTGKMFEC